MTALSDAERAVAEARRDVHEFLYPLAAPVADEARAAIARLEAAVRHHDAETVREFAVQEDGLLDTPEAAAYVRGIRDGADRIDPKETPEVEVRFADGPTIRIARFTVTTEAGVGLVGVEGFISSRTGQPPSGDAVRIAYLGIPGRGALADITASVELFTRLEVLNIRIRTSIRPREGQ